jgi:hypothetical protein
MTPSTFNPLNIQKLTVLLFYADGNHLKETEQLEKQLKSFLPDIEFFKINIRANPKMGESFHVQQTPLTLFLHNGKEIWRQADPLSDAGLLYYLGQNSWPQENELPQN